ncbi:MAG: PAS domain S-box protein [Chroococcidiopsis sp.]
MTEILRTILLVDGCEEDWETYRCYLLQDKQNAYRILAAASGEQALELCSEQFPDAIVLNYLLPDRDGLEVLNQLKALTGKDDLPVIVLTGQGNEEIAVQAIASGAANYLVKGNTTSESLRLTIHQVLEQTRLKQQLEESQAALRQARDELKRVTRRTVQLEQINQELQITLEELQVDQKEICQQNEELADARAALELERQRYQDLFEQAPDGYLVADIWGNIQAANRAASALLGVKKNYLVGKPLINYIAPSERQTFRTQLSQLQQLQDWEVYLQPRKGTSFPATIAATSMYDPQGQLVGWRWLLHDITDRQQMQQCLQAAHDNLEQLVTERTAELSQANAKLQEEIRERQLAETCLQQSEARYRTIAELTSDYIYTKLITPEGTAIEEWATPNLSRITGYTHEEFFDGMRTWFDIIYPEDLPIVRQFFDRLLQQKHSGTLEYRIITKQGEVRWIRDRIQPEWDDADKRVVRILGAAEDISDCKQAEVALRQSEEIARQQLVEIAAIYATAPVGLCFVDTELRFVRTNEQLAEINGVPALEHIGRTIREVLPQLSAELEPLYQQVIQSGLPILNYEISGMTRAQPGIERIWLANYYPLKGVDEQVLGVNVVVQEITERKAAEQRLHESEARYRTISELTSDFIYSCSVTPGGTIIDEWMTPNLNRITNYTFEELPKGENGWLNLIYPDDRSLASQLINEILANNQSGSIEYRIVNKHGEIRWIRDRIQPQWDELEGRVVRLLGAVEDISDRKLAEQKIREQAELLDVASDAIFVRDLESCILYWNSGAERLYGWLAAEVLGRNPGEFLCQQISSQIEEAFKVVVEQGEWQGELNKIAKSGREVIVQSRWTLLHDGAGQPKSILVVDTDITEKKQLEAQFLRAQRLENLGILASGIAHDLNNILQPILTTAQLLKLKFPDADDWYQQILFMLETSAKRGAYLVKQILSFARGVEAKQTVVQVRHLLKDVEQLAKQTFPKTIEIKTNIAPDLWTVSADATQLHQVFMNLVVNARDAMPDGGTLSLSAANLRVDRTYARMNIEAKVGDYVVVTVADTGCGIAPEIIDRVFDPFFTTKELGQGTGLGLSTVLGIIKNHGGFVQVESKVTKGTQFRVYLPTGVCNAEQQLSELELLAGRGELILIVDDEVAVQQITQTSLEAYNYRTLTASNGIEAIATYADRKQKIDVVLIDMMMPSMDGLTTIRTLRRMNPQIEIIATSGLTSNSQQIELAGISVSAFLSKPYTLKELLDTLNHLLGSCPTKVWDT